MRRRRGRPGPSAAPTTTPCPPAPPRPRPDGRDGPCGAAARRPPGRRPAPPDSARPSAAPRVCPAARASTRCCTARALSSSRYRVASQIAAILRSSSSPSCQACNVSGSRVASCTACPNRAAAENRDSRNANPTSSGANRLIAEALSEEARSGSSPGRRRANSANTRACRASAHPVNRSKPTTASINSASDNPAGSAAAACNSTAEAPDGRPISDRPQRAGPTPAPPTGRQQGMPSRLVHPRRDGLPGRHRLEHTFDYTSFL